MSRGWCCCLSFSVWGGLVLGKLVEEYCREMGARAHFLGSLLHVLSQHICPRWFVLSRRSCQPSRNDRGWKLLGLVSKGLGATGGSRQGAIRSSCQASDNCVVLLRARKIRIRVSGEGPEGVALELGPGSWTWAMELGVGWPGQSPKG